MKSIIGRIKTALIHTLIIFTTVIFTLFIFDKFLGSRGLPNLPVIDMEANENTLRTLELFPYSGWHIQANFHHKGDMPWEHQPYKDYDVKSGSMGFFVDFDLNDPPPKGPNEFRIILIGGSGAQGWGARTNEDMLYRQLEHKLNSLLKDTGFEFKVINMAMGASIAYQNFIDLNRFAHPLEPDFILSYSGVNDISVPFHAQNLNDGFYYFNQLNALALASRGSEFPPRIRPLVKLFPNIFKKTRLGMAFKTAFSSSYFMDRAQQSYKESRGLDYTDNKRFFNEVVVPFYVSSMESIKRDFSGIPIMIAWQAKSKEEAGNFEAELGTGYYNDMFERVSRKLDGYYNKEWYFINIHKMFEGDPRPEIATHLGNEGHKLVAGIIASELASAIRRRISATNIK